jgi:hypothetical protein
VPNAFSTWATVPEALIQRWLAGASAVTAKPAERSHARTEATWSAVGAKRLRNWSGVRYCP